MMFVQKKKILLALLYVCWLSCCRVNAAEQTREQSMGADEKGELLDLMCDLCSHRENEERRVKVQGEIERVGVNTDLCSNRFRWGRVNKEFPFVLEDVRDVIGTYESRVGINIRFAPGDRVPHALLRLNMQGLFDFCVAQPDINIHLQNAQGQTSFHIACLQRCSDAIKCILPLCPHLDMQDEYGNTPLHYWPENPDLSAYAEKCSREKFQKEAGLGSVVRHWVRNARLFPDNVSFPAHILHILELYLRWSDPRKIQNRDGLIPGQWEKPVSLDLDKFEAAMRKVDKALGSLGY